MKNMYTIDELRATKEGDPTKWGVLDCLRATIRDLEANKIEANSVYIAMAKLDDKRQVITLSSYVAGLSYLEAIGVISLHLNDIV